MAVINKDFLIQFERDIATEFEAGHIRAPVHLAGGNESELIEIFKDIKPEDFCFSTHRSHLHALLKGVPPELVKAEIMAGHSISLQFPEYHFFTSAIVGGICPIAMGMAMTGQKTWCFVGDASAHTGIFRECYDYSLGHRLPIKFIIEDNNLSVDTPTRHLWGGDSLPVRFPFTGHYHYTRAYPHQGSGKWVTF